MKTIDLTRDKEGVVLTLQLTECELTALAALVEQGQRKLRTCPGTVVLHDIMSATADEFCSLLGHLELLAEDE